VHDPGFGINGPSFLNVRANFARAMTDVRSKFAPMKIVGLVFALSYSRQAVSWLKEQVFPDEV